MSSTCKKIKEVVDANKLSKIPSEFTCDHISDNKTIVN